MVKETKVDTPYSFEEVGSPLKLHILEIIGGSEVNSQEVADQVGIDRKHSTRYLLHYHRQGLLKRRKSHREFLYELTEQGKKRKEYLKNQVEEYRKREKEKEEEE